MYFIINSEYPSLLYSLKNTNSTRSYLSTVQLFDKSSIFADSSCACLLWILLLLLSIIVYFVWKVHPLSRCAFYVQDGCAKRTHCEVDYLFDAVHAWCTYPADVDCGTRPSPTTTSTTRRTTTSDCGHSLDCRGMPDGFYGDPYNCRYVLVWICNTFKWISRFLTLKYSKFCTSGQWLFAISMSAILISGPQLSQFFFNINPIFVFPHLAPQTTCKCLK